MLGVLIIMISIAISVLISYLIHEIFGNVGSITALILFIFLTYFFNIVTEDMEINKFILPLGCALIMGSGIFYKRSPKNH